MASGSEYFGRSGPIHLTSIDWNNAHHRRSVAASLVEGVYMLEDDRQARRQGSQSQLAPPWWEFFHFKLISKLVDNDDGSIFGAIFEYKPQAYAYHRSIDRSPRYVIAFRGTIIKLESFLRDLELDFDIIRNGLHRTTRFGIAMKAVQDMVAAVGGGSNVWLTGHSLGAAMAMLAGKNMAKRDNFLEAFLFNPPYISPPIERINNRRVRHGLRFAGSLITAGLAVAAAANDNINNNNNSSSTVNGYEDSFAAISGWIPCLFVNQFDYICSEYIGYFKNRKRLEDIGFGALARVSSRHSLADMVMSAAGITDVETSEPLHLLPSANLIVNLNPSQDFNLAHGLSQWWRPNLNVKSTVYKYK